MASSGISASVHTLDVLGTRLHVRTDQAALVAPFVEVFAAFVVDGGEATRPAGSNTVEVEIDDVAGRYTDGGREVELAVGELRAAQVYNLLYTTMVRALEDVYLLHAAVVARHGRALLVSGPSGSGKTSLGRALVARGFELMSDDLAPLSVEDGQVHPFPRRLGLLREDPGAPARVAGGTIELGDKAFVDPARLGIRVADRPVPPSCIFLMNPFDGEVPGSVQLTVGVIGDPEAFRSRLAACEGVEIAAARTDGGCTVLETRLRGGRAIAHAEQVVAAAESPLLFHYRGYGTSKTYAEQPRVERITVQDAALGLLREALNREPASALMRRLGGKLAAALFELSGLLADVDCYGLVLADVESTADLPVRHFEDPDSAR